MAHQTLPQFEQEIHGRLGQGDLAGAAGSAAACRRAWPDASAGWLLGSIVALLTGEKDAALALIEERLKAAPTDPQCLLQKAECLLVLGDRVAALAAADAAAQHSGEGVATFDAVAEFLNEAREYSGALALFDRALARAPRDPMLLAKRAVVHRFLGNLELAERDYEAVLAIEPVVPKALKALTELRRQTPERNWIAPMERALAALPADSVHAAIVHFGLAKSHEDLGDHAASWRHLATANRIERALIDYAVTNDTLLMDALREVMCEVEPLQADTTGARPIFVVGLPRSGTTLVERILSSHSQVHSGGELTAMPEAVSTLVTRRAESPSSDAHIHAERLAALDGPSIAREYLALTRTVRREPLRLLDKQLTNFFFCPFIRRAFPQARIVHLTRHPLAACHAIYRTRFNGTYPFAYDLGEIAEFYVSYRALMANWERVLPGAIVNVAYEDVVADLEGATRRLLEFVGLEFEPACLEFHRNPAPVITTSSVQVRQPLYDSSLHLWKHYAAELAPVRARLESAGIALD
ncbi:MAG TPA: sulfotransferase [Steroidobacteraceae bacterium]|nr:sulfotransferase [Steroidobacteraceae bacterium]